LGPITKTVQDASILLRVAGFDPVDASTLKISPTKPARAKASKARIRLAIPSNYFFDSINPDVRRIVRRAIITLLEMGAEIREVHIPHVESSGTLVSVIDLVESAEYRAVSLRNKPNLLSPDVRTLLELGSLIPGIYYSRAQRFRRQLKNALESVLDDVDAIVTPTLPAPPALLSQETYKFGKYEKSIPNTYTRYCIPFSLGGFPAISIPCRFTKDGLPVGLQIVGKTLQESMVFRIAQAYENATDWHLRKPPI